MIVLRSASLMAPQVAISAKVRPQPIHRPVWPLTAQTLMHGLVTGAGWFTFRAKRLDSEEQFDAPSNVSIINKITLTVDTTYRISISA